MKFSNGWDVFQKSSLSYSEPCKDRLSEMTPINRVGQICVENNPQRNESDSVDNDSSSPSLNKGLSKTDMKDKNLTIMERQKLWLEKKKSKIKAHAEATRLAEEASLKFAPDTSISRRSFSSAKASLGKHYKQPNNTEKKIQKHERGPVEVWTIVFIFCNHKKTENFQ